jgi:hypothetical protein
MAPDCDLRPGCQRKHIVAREWVRLRCANVCDGLACRGCAVSPAADPALLVCDASSGKFLEAAPEGRVRHGIAFGMAAGYGGFDCLSPGAFSAGLAAARRRRCGIRIDRVRSVDFLARESRSGRRAAGGKNGTLRRGRNHSRGDLRADSASALCRIVPSNYRRMPAGGKKHDVDRCVALGVADARGDFIRRARNARPLWSRIRRIQPPRTALCAVGREATRRIAERES